MRRMPVTQVQIETTDGNYTADIVTPEGAGPWPAVILFFDASGRRPAMTENAERIAKSGYLVAIPDIFHRAGNVEKVLPPDADLSNGVTRAIFSNDEAKKRFFAEFYGPALDYKNLETDVGPLLDHLQTRADVKKGPVGTTGYCMGGNASVRVATIFGDRIAATASFHGGGLVSNQPDSPHKRAAQIKSKVYVAGAIEDGSFTDEAKATLTKTLADAKVPATVETYQAHHGFAVPDHKGAFDPAAQQRHFEAMERLFGETLK